MTPPNAPTAGATPLTAGQRNSALLFASCLKADDETLRSWLCGYEATLVALESQLLAARRGEEAAREALDEIATENSDDVVGEREWYEFAKKLQSRAALAAAQGEK